MAETKTNKWKIVCYFLGGLFFIVVIFSIVFLKSFYKDIFLGQNLALNQEEEEKITEEKCQDCVRRLIDGIWVEPGSQNSYPLAVVIDNLPEARPAFGLSRASLVYEAEAEGGITRYLAIFSADENLEKIGPVRSVRPYFLDWAGELGALIVHCGGSPEALARIIKENRPNLNEFYQGAYFWRDKNRPGPHNIFTSSELLSVYLEKQAQAEANYFSWKFKDPPKSLKEDEIKNPAIKIEYYSPVLEKDFVVEWKYDIINNEYARYLAGVIHKTAEDEIIAAKNIIIQYEEARVIDSELRLRMETIGEGRAVICLDGSCQEGKWQKKSKTERTRYYYENNEEAELNAGRTWVEIVRPEREVVIEENF